MAKDDDTVKEPNKIKPKKESPRKKLEKEINTIFKEGSSLERAMAEDIYRVAKSIDKESNAVVEAQDKFESKSANLENLKHQRANTRDQKEREKLTAQIRNQEKIVESLGRQHTRKFEAWKSENIRQLLIGGSSNVNLHDLGVAARREAETVESLIGASAIYKTKTGHSLDKQIQEKVDQRASLSKSIKDKLLEVRDSNKISDIDEKSLDVINLTKELQKNIQESGVLYRAKQEQHRAGTDLEGKFAEIAKRAPGIFNRNMAEQISNEVKEGKYGDLKTNREKLSKLDESFIDSKKELDRLVESGSATADQLEELSSKLVDFGDQIEKQKDIVEELQQQEQAQKAISAKNLNALMSGLNAASGAVGVARYAAVDSEIDQVRAKSGLMRIMNNKFDLQVSASQGDVMSALLSADQDALIARSSQLSDRANDAEKASLALGTSAVLAEGAAFVGSRGMVGSVGSIAQGATDVAKSGIAFSKNIPQAAAAINSYGANMEAMKELRHIQAVTGQKLFDFNMGAGKAVMGFGSRASQAFDDISNSKKAANLGSMFGITPEQQLALYQMGGRALGSSFVNSEGSGFYTVARAAGLQSKRIMESGDYLQTLGAFNEAGAGSASASRFEDILANATERGVNNAKVLIDMSRGVVDMSSSFAARGIDVTAGATAMLTGGLSSYSIRGASEEMKINSVKASAQRLGEIMTDTSLTLPSIIRQQAVSKAFPNVTDPIQRSLLSTVSPQQAISWIKASKGQSKDDKNKAIDEINNMGLGGAFLNKDRNALDEEKIKELIRANITGISATLNIPQEDLQAFLEDKKTNLTDSQKSSLYSTLGQGAGGLLNTNSKGGSSLPDITGGLENVQKIEQAAASSQARLMEEGAKLNSVSGQAADAFKNLTDIMIEQSKKLSDASKQAVGVAETGSSMNLTDFKTATTTFSQAVDKFAASVDLKTQSTTFTDHLTSWRPWTPVTEIFNKITK